MENQHRKIKGYRELDQQEIDMMNEIKSQGVELGKLIEKLKWLGAENSEGGVRPDMRWVAIGNTHLQQGLMALTRAVTKPDFF